MTIVTGELLAIDPAVPMREALLDPATAPIPIDTVSVEVVRCKYRVGESMRVLYRCATADGERLVTVRASAGRAPRWWLFPDDRRLRGIDALLEPSPSMVALIGDRDWARSEVAEYAPERSITVRVVGADGRPTAYAKHYAGRDVRSLAARYEHVARALDDSGAPRPLGWSPTLGVLVLEAVPGTRWADAPPAAAASTADAMGRAIASLHVVPAPAGTPTFARLSVRRVAGAATVLAAARPDLAAPVGDLARQLAALRRAPAPVFLHGDCHPKNAIVDDERLVLIDLDQAATGAAAADIGSLLARVRVGDIVGGHDTFSGAQVGKSFLAGYASQRALPPDDELRWHTAAALLVEQGVRAVNRVRADVLVRLPDVLEAATDLLRRGPS